MKEGLRNESPRLEGDHTQPKNAWEVSLEDLPAGSQREAMESAGFSNKADWKYATEMGFGSADEFYKSLANKPYDQLTFREKGILEGITRPDQEAQITKADASDYIENQANQPLQLGFNPENSSLDYLDKLRQEAFAKGGADDADFAKYNQLYTERLSEIKGRIEADKQNQPLALEYSGGNSPDAVNMTQEGVIEGLVVKDSGEKNNAQVQIEQPSNEKNESKKDSIELSDAEKKFYELSSKGASAEELARFRREVRSGLIQKDELTPENEAMLERMLEASLEVGSQERELNKANSSIDTDSNIEEKAGRFQKIKKFIGSRVMKWGALGMLGITLGGIGSKIVYDWLSSDDNSPQTEQTFSGTVHADSLNEAANFNSDGSVAESEKNFNNGKYDSENDDYNKIDQKENKYSIGTDISKLSNEEYQKKMIESHNEDDIEYMGQFFVNDAESARNLLGISNNEVDDLVDAARSGDQTAFQKLNDAYSKYMEGAKVVGNQTLDGDYYSLFVNSNKDYAHSEGAFGGTARIVELKNGQQILIRDQCKQMVMKKIAEVPNTWTTPVIPFEETYTPPAPNTENPPAPTPNTPPETPPKTPPTTPETPPNTPPETPPETPPTPETPPEKHDDTKFKTDQSIYNIDNAVTRMDKGELMGEASQEERNNNINPEVTPGTVTGKIKAEGVDESIDVSKIGEQPAGYAGETTAEAQAQAAEQAKQAQAEAEAKAREAEQAQNKTVNIGGETVNYNDVWAAQQNYNQTYGASAATNQNNTQQ